MSGYIGTQPVPQATQHRETFTATASQTTFATVGYTPQFVDVYLNGVHLLDTVDYTATNSSDVVLTTGAAASDIVEIISYTPFEVANQTFTGTTTVDVLTATGAFTSLGIDDNATSTAITIDASENVGIGASSPSAPLQVASAAGAIPALGAASSHAAIGSGGFGTMIGTKSTGVGYIQQQRFDGTATAYDLLLQPNGGNVGIGTVTPEYPFEVEGASNTYMQLVTPNNTGSAAVFFGDSDANGIGRITYAHSNDRMYFHVNAGTKAQITSAGALLVGTSAEGSAGAGDIVANGGVYLGGTAAANKLDDYEEGTWTPTIAFGGASVGLTYLSNTGRYTKIGNSVTIWWGTVLSAKGSSTGSLTITGLPFLPDIPGSYMAPNGVVKFNNCTSISGSMMAQVSSSNLLSIQDNSATATNVVNDANLSNSSWILGSVTYKVA